VPPERLPAARRRGIVIRRRRAAAAIAWHAVGERRVSPGWAAAFRFAIDADTEVTLECQRCCSRCAVSLHRERAHLLRRRRRRPRPRSTPKRGRRLAPDAALESGDLIEGRAPLALAAGAAPRSSCPEPLPRGRSVEDDPATGAGLSNPFAVLAA
jgi:uncharacterized protein